MPALKPTEHYATITWIGRVQDSTQSLAAEPLQQADLSFDGIAGECHSGRTRPACVRVSAQHPEGTEIANVRQMTILSAEELAATAQEMGLDALNPGWVGASLVIEGIADFTHVPPSSRLQADNGTCLVIDMENRPCTLPGRVIDGEKPGFGASYKAAARNRRGVTAWVERPGGLKIGDRLRLHVPDQRAWQP